MAAEKFTDPLPLITSPVPNPSIPSTSTTLLPWPLDTPFSYVSPRGKTYTIRPATLEDGKAFMTIFHESFTPDPLFETMWGKVDTAELIKGDIGRYERDFVREGRRCWVAVEEESGEMAAISKWWFPYTATASDLESWEADEKAADAASGPLPGFQVELAGAFLGQLRKYRDIFIAREEMYFMNVLGVSPHHQRQGLGSALLRPVLALADSEGRKTYIEASPRGEPLYRKFGWEDIYTADGQGEAREDGLKREIVVLDLAKYGGPEKNVGTTLLMRNPWMGALMMREARAGLDEGEK